VGVARSKDCLFVLRRLATLASLAVSTVVLPGSPALGANPSSTAVITSPAAGSTVGGDDVGVRAVFTADASDIAPLSADLFVDGVGASSALCPEANPAPAICTIDFDWYTRDLAPGDHVLQVQMSTAANHEVLGPEIHVTLVKAAQPLVSVTSPTAGTSVSGVTSVMATASTPGWNIGALPKYLRLIVDGYGVGDPVTCPTDIDECTTSFSWDASPLTGPHQVSVVLVTGDHYTLSPSVAVTAAEPTPTATILSPSYDSTVSGSVTVATSGSTAAAAFDQPKTMQLLVDGAPYGVPHPCPLGTTPQHGCTVLIPWQTGALYGPHLLQVRMQTATTSVLSAAQRVNVAARQATVTVGGLRYAGVDYVKGRVIGSNHAGIPGAAVTVTITQAGRPQSRLTLTTSADGTFATPSPLPLTVNTHLVAQVGVALSSASATNLVSVAPRITCAVPATIRHATKATVVCRVPGTPNGTIATLWYDGKSGLHAAAHARAKSGKVTLTFAIAKKAHRLQAWVVTNGNVKYVKGQSRPSKLHVV
jgi:hypothetical protein